jgi:hypothetical protein
MYIAIIYKPAQRRGFCGSVFTPAPEVAREALRMLDTRYENGYRTRRRGATASSGAGFPAQLRFNI